MSEVVEIINIFMELLHFLFNKYLCFIVILFQIYDPPPSYEEITREIFDSPSRTSPYRNGTADIVEHPLPSYDEAVFGHVVTVSDYSTPNSPNHNNYRNNPCHGNSTNELFTSPTTSRTNTPPPTNEQSGATLVPYICFNVEKDVHGLRAALKTRNKDQILDILCNRSAEQRTIIAQHFERIYDTPLPRSIKNHIGTSWSFPVLMCGLSMPLYEFMARAIHNSTSFSWICYIMFVLSHDCRFSMKIYFEASEYLELFI